MGIASGAVEDIASFQREDGAVVIVLAGAGEDVVDLLIIDMLVIAHSGTSGNGDLSEGLHMGGNYLTLGQTLPEECSSCTRLIVNAYDLALGMSGLRHS